MRAPGLKNEVMGFRVILKQKEKILENAAVEWYSGNQLHTRPVRIRIKGVWEDVIRFEKGIVENEKNERVTKFRCNIGDNRIVTVIVSTTKTAGLDN